MTSTPIADAIRNIGQPTKTAADDPARLYEVTVADQYGARNVLVVAEGYEYRQTCNTFEFALNDEATYEIGREHTISIRDITPQARAAEELLGFIKAMTAIEVGEAPDDDSAPF